MLKSLTNPTKISLAKPERYKMYQQLLLSVLIVVLGISHLGSSQPGAYSPISADDSEVKEIAEFALNEIDDSEHLSKIIRIDNAQSQTVAGKNYKMDITYGPTVCKRGSTTDRSSCALQQNGPMRTCEVVVFNQPWTKTRKLTEFGCQ